MFEKGENLNHDYKNDIEIFTFGDFDIRIGNKSIIEGLGRKYKILELFKFFISHKNKKLLPEIIIENLFEYNESDDLKNVLRTQIFRLRKFIEEIKRQININELLFDIEFINGYYILKISDNLKIDNDIFELSIEKANMMNLNSLKAANYYEKALKVYIGEYMGECSCGDWIIPIRNRYNRIFIHSANKLISIYKENSMFKEIADICEKVIEIQPFDETFHIYYMEALKEMGQIKHALSYYEYTTYKMYKDYDMKPSIAMKDLYRKLQIANGEKIITDLYFIEKRLKDSEVQGAMYCDLEYFKFLYNLEKRKSIRGNVDTYISLITLNHKKRTTDNLKQSRNVLKAILLKSLRKGDVITFWNEDQAIIMITEIKSEFLYLIEDRIQKQFRKYLKGNCNLEFKFNKISNSII